MRDDALKAPMMRDWLDVPIVVNRVVVRPVIVKNTIVVVVARPCDDPIV